MKKLGLYIHIPFCLKKCAYCDFYSITHTSEAERKYIGALCSHIKAESHLYKDCEFDTVYFGGGTPSILSPTLFSELADCIKNSLNLTQGAEFSIEANPGTLTKEKLIAYKNGGVNRLSIGLQSADSKMLSCLGRVHSLSQFEESFRLARACGFDNISVDVMYGLPSQKKEDFLKTLDYVCEFNPEHISAYCLKIEENTPFGKVKDTLSLPSEEQEYEMYMSLCHFLSQKGYEQYEISNFAKSGYRSRHNLKYWLSQEYVSFGPASHSYFEGVRYFYPKDINAYISESTAGVPAKISEEMAEPDLKMEKMDEYVMLKLRLSDGISEMEFFALFGTELTEEYPQLENFVKSGHVSHKNGVFSFTPQGFFVSNYILTSILHF